MWAGGAMAKLVKMGALDLGGRITAVKILRIVFFCVWGNRRAVRFWRASARASPTSGVI